MSSRISNSIASKRSREALVRFLCPLDKEQKRHSYSELRQLYLERAHSLHPDKFSNKNGGLSKEGANQKFIELKNAWESYNQSVQFMMVTHSRSGSTGDEGGSQSDFTMFGVGCSFADSEEERENRNKIMDQASRGWFAAGYIGCEDDENLRRFKSLQDESDHLRLSDDGLFESHEGHTERRTSKERRRSLVQGVNTWKR
mmetsp:Transcript_13335/g.31514  ORF Transcript_13335/g.31514 Transcript_13335/m.31514 type:complete len:200 (+) Transcript_13335:216-815(+)